MKKQSLLQGSVAAESMKITGEKEEMIMGLTHFDENGKAVMVDVTDKAESVREATAAGKITVSRQVFDAISAGTIGKGDVLGMATTAGIMGAKRTSELIPMCHILPITKCRVNFETVPEECAVYCYCTVKVTGKTGVEMEALTGVSVALLTVYDMCKALDKAMEIGEIYLCRKTGGKSGEVRNEKPQHSMGAEFEGYQRTEETKSVKELDYQLGKQVRQKPDIRQKSKKGTLDDLDIL